MYGNHDSSGREKQTCAKNEHILNAVTNIVTCEACDAAFGFWGYGTVGHTTCQQCKPHLLFHAPR